MNEETGSTPKPGNLSLYTYFLTYSSFSMALLLGMERELKNGVESDGSCWLSLNDCKLSLSYGAACGY